MSSPSSPYPAWPPESLDLAPTGAELEAYASYTESMGEGYVHLLALQDRVLATLRDGAAIS